MPFIENCSDYFGDREPVWEITQDNRMAVEDVAFAYVHGHFYGDDEQMRAVAAQAVASVECMPEAGFSGDYDRVCGVLSEATALAEGTMTARPMVLDVDRDRIFELSTALGAA